MQDLRKVTLTTLEVAEMMEVSHSDLLKKIEGMKDRKGYIQIMTEGQMSVSDFFLKYFLTCYNSCSILVVKGDAG